MSPKKFLLGFALRHYWLVGITVILGFSGALFNGVSIALVVPLLGSFLGAGSATFKGGPAVLQKILAFFNNFPEEQRVFAITGTVILAIILKNSTNFLNIVVAGHLSRTLVNEMRLDAIRLLLSLDLDFFTQNKISDISNRINQEILRAASAIRIAISMLGEVITITVFVVILVSLSWHLTILAVLALGFLALCNQFFIKKAKIYGRILSQKAKQSTNKLFDILTGIRLIKGVSNENQEYKWMEKLIKERENADFLSQINYAIINPINEVFGIAILFTIVFLGQFSLLKDNSLSGEAIIIYLFFLIRLLPFIGQLNGDRSRFSNAIPSVEIAADFLRRDDKPIMKNGSIPYTKLQNSINFEEVGFTYPRSKDPVLHEITLHIPKGKTTAFVGSSGAGKSTLVDLVPRFYDVTNGSIKIDGIDIREYDLSSIRKSIGIVSQDTFLFSNTVRYNITYGMENVSDETLIEATKRANAYEFIMQLPKQFETEVGDRGVILSGGQRQRLVIARAILRNPDILILDEATSALDTVSERLVQEALEELCRDRTTLVIAHRLSTIRNAHQIAVLDKGRLVELGSHEELLAKDGFYANLHMMQFGKPKRKKVALPTNEALIRASIRASHELRTRLSYEVRARLNAMLGSLQLVSDNLVDTEEERQELIEESYDSAIKLLSVISYFEKNGAKIPID